MEADASAPSDAPAADDEASTQDLYAQRFEDEAIRQRTEAALRALQADRDEIKSLAIDEDSLEQWRAERKRQLDELTAHMQQELDAHVPMPEYEPTRVDVDATDHATGAVGAQDDEPEDISIAVQAEVRSADGDDGARTTSRGDVMAELAAREARRAELLAALGT